VQKGTAGTPIERRQPTMSSLNGYIGMSRAPIYETTAEVLWPTNVPILLATALHRKVKSIAAPIATTPAH
jgi:hypothetical protein